MSKETQGSLPRRQMKVLAMGLPRTGTLSMATALKMLGYQGVHHGVEAIDRSEDWKLLEQACDATFPNLPSYTGKPWTQEDWSRLYGEFEAVTDMASVFGRHLVNAYPDAKVILVRRDFDKWYKSMDDNVFNQLWSAAASFAIRYVEPVIGSHAGMGSRKAILGLFQARTVDEIRKNARETYDRHHKEIEEATAPGQLLHYRMGDGWGPLCEFLDKPVPDEPFPRVNEAAELQKTVKDKARRNLTAACRVVAPWLIGVLAVAGYLQYR